MKKIKIQLNTKSIRDTIKYLEQKKQLIIEKQPKYVELAADKIIARANQKIDEADLGENVKKSLVKGWRKKWVSKNKLSVWNISRWAVYVEFGVGIIGQTDKHPNANNTNYEYNVPSEHKFGQGYWQFHISNKSLLDLPEDAIIDETLTEDGVSIITQGTKGVWFLYNAIEDFKMYDLKPLLQDIEKECWG